MSRQCCVWSSLGTGGMCRHSQLGVLLSSHGIAHLLRPLEQQSTILICVFRSFRFRPFHLDFWIFSLQPADKLNKEPTSLYIQPLPAIDLCLQPAVLQWSLSSLQLTSANKGIIVIVQQSSTPLYVWRIICVLTSEDRRWRARFQKCSNPVVLVLVQLPNVGKKWLLCFTFPAAPSHNNC